MASASAIRAGRAKNAVSNTTNVKCPTATDTASAPTENASALAATKANSAISVSCFVSGRRLAANHPIRRGPPRDRDDPFPLFFSGHRSPLVLSFFFIFPSAPFSGLPASDVQRARILRRWRLSVQEGLEGTRLFPSGQRCHAVSTRLLQSGHLQSRIAQMRLHRGLDRRRLFQTGLRNQLRRTRSMRGQLVRLRRRMVRRILQ